MKCDDAKKLCAGKALDELEAAEDRALADHLAGCADCRAESELARRVVAALKTGDEGSEVRRERAVAAMNAARAPRFTRRRWLAASLAAAVLVALAVPFLLPKPGLLIEKLDGTAWIDKASGGRLEARVGDRLQSGDRLGTQGVVNLAGHSRLKVLVHRDSEVVYERAPGVEKLCLDKGAMRVDAPEKPVEILDPLGRRAVVEGSCEARYSSVGAHPRDPSARKSEFLIHVKKGAVRFEGSGDPRALVDGQTLTVTDEGTVSVDGVPGRNK